ncbi:MAG: methylmalonyl-CoA mutase family protein, partial [Spirochaetota bacterium]|nr:methylmalonyl-CoA mutase family protein [Spirochaetota bacterium]
MKEFDLGGRTAMKTAREKRKWGFPVRVVTATALFDGHDVAINIIRRLLQAQGAEVIHLGHNRSVEEIVSCAIQEDVQAVAVSSYQGGHVEYYKYLRDLLDESGGEKIRVFGGGGGVILAEEIEELCEYGIEAIYTPEDGRTLGLNGMVAEMLKGSDYATVDAGKLSVDKRQRDFPGEMGKWISAAENKLIDGNLLLEEAKAVSGESDIPVIGICGPGGAGKSSVIDELILRLLKNIPDLYIGIISVDPSSSKNRGALLGDRIRMNYVSNPRVYMRSMATRGSLSCLTEGIDSCVAILKLAGYGLILLESAGTGQGDSEMAAHSDFSLYVMTPEYGSPLQLEKIDMLSYANLVVMNKSDRRGAQDALWDVRKQYQRNHGLFERDVKSMPVYAVTASQSGDRGMDRLFVEIIRMTQGRWDGIPSVIEDFEDVVRKGILRPHRENYLREAAQSVRRYNDMAEKQAEIANELFCLRKAIELIQGEDEVKAPLEKKYREIESQLDESSRDIIHGWEEKLESYRKESFVYRVRNKDYQVKSFVESLSGLKIPLVALPDYQNWGDIVRWSLRENVPGEFPYTAGVYPFRREDEDSTRMFAGEGSPERTNRRFHLLSREGKGKRLSTAFDSVTLYGGDPTLKADVYGKIGNAGVSVCCLDDMKKLYSGF